MTRIKMALVAVLAAAVTLATAGNAYAGTNALAHYWDANGTLRAKATFEDYGEIVRACDHASDGHSAVAQLQAWIPEFAGYEDYRNEWASGGSGTCSSANINLPEGAPVRIRACIGEAGSRTIIACGNWGEATA
jgi:hypothetical protein